MKQRLPTLRALRVKGGQTEPDAPDPSEPGGGASSAEDDALAAASSGVVSGAIWSGATWLFGLALGFPVTVVLVRLMSATAYGELTVGLATVGIITAIAGIGLSPAVTQIASARIDDREAAARDVAAAARPIARRAGALACVTIVLLVTLGRGQFGAATWAVVALAPVAALAPTQGALLGYFRALRRPRIPESAQMLATFGGAAGSVIAVVVGLRTSVEIAVVRSAAWLLGFAVLARTARIGSRPGAGRQTRKILAMGAPLMLASLMWTTILQLDVLFVGLVRDPAAAGAYGPISRMSEFVASTFAITGAYLLPALTASLASDDHRTFRMLYHRTSRFGLCLALPIAAVLLAVPTRAAHAVYGSDFAVDPTILRVLTAGTLTAALLGFNSLALEAGGRARLLAGRATVALGFNVVACATLVPAYGVAGAAWATTLTLLLINLLNSWFLWRTQGVLPWDRAIVFQVAIALLVAAAAAAASSRIGDDLVAACFVGAAVTVACALTTGAVELRRNPAAWARLRDR
ncbi:MAG: putative polysaccharide biosynthesis protein [Actinomycetia bacterium]|nr:putative polysaccharide biosynthesis protein [Actinomycetes bacterium]